MDLHNFVTLVAFAAFIFIVYLVYALIAPFIVPFIWAGAIGILTYPLYRRILNRFKGRKNLAAAFMTTVTVVAVVGPAIALMFFLVQEMTAAYEYLGTLTGSGAEQNLRAMQYHPAIGPWIERLHDLAALFNFDIRQFLINAANRGTAFALAHLTELLKNVFAFIFKVVFLVIALFFIYRDGELFQRNFWALLPMRRGNLELLSETVRKMLVAVIYGIFLTCIVQGILGGIGFWIAGLPSALLFGALMAATAIIPVVGTGLVWLPAALYLLAQGQVFSGVFLILWGAIVVSAIDNILRPLFISGKSEIPLFVVVVGALGGLASYGFTGLLVGPVVIAIFRALMEIYRIEQVAGHGGR